MSLNYKNIKLKLLPEIELTVLSCVAMDSMIGRTAENLLDYQTMRSNLGSKAAPLRTYLAI